MTSGAAPPTEDDDVVPVSVRLGQVVPPEDPEDWTRPLTWVAAAGMLAAPLFALLWFAIGPPYVRPDIIASGKPWTQSGSLATLALAGTLAFGAALAGSTQQGKVRAFAGTLAAALFAAVVTVGVGAAMAGQRSPNGMSPTLMHALAAAIGGFVGASAASLLAARVAETGRLVRIVAPGLLGAGIAVLLALMQMPITMPGS